MLAAFFVLPKQHMTQKLEKLKGSIFPEGLSLAEIQNLPDDELNTTAERAGVTRAKMDFLIFRQG